MLQLNSIPQIRKPANSPFVSFAKGTKEREALVLELENIRRSVQPFPNLPLWIGGRVIAPENDLRACVPPHDFKRVLGFYYTASEEHVVSAIKKVLAAKKRWNDLHWYYRLMIFQTAARLLETKYLYKMVAAVMEDYSKNAYEAFIDVQELIDFWRFNSYYAYALYSEQPESNADTSNLVNYRPLEGFVYAVPPNNFVAIEGNLPTAPLIMGNVVVVKPSSDVVYSFHIVLNILLEAGLPPDVMAVLHGDSKMISDIVLNHPMLSGIHFTGGTDVFKEMRWTVAQNEYKGLYKGFVRIVGETGGKDPIVVFDEHDPVATAAAIVMGGFGAQGRKCSATSRVYMTVDMWQKVRRPLLDFMNTIKIGDVADFKNYMGSSINKKEHDKIVRYIVNAKGSKESVGGQVQEVLGGEYHENNGWFIWPTVIVTSDPHYVTMEEEIFGPVVTICTLPKKNYKAKVFKFCDETSPYGLTGAVHTNDIYEFCEALDELRYVAGNMYNFKTTGAMVGAQPFSGGRLSGTNSKVGWWPNLLQWVEMQTLGFTYNKPTDFAPPYLDRE